MQSQILPLTGKDYPDITAVWEVSVRASHHFLSEADIQFYKPLITAEFLPALHLYGIFQEAGGIAAFVGVAEDKIEMLFVHPDHFGKGYGKALCSFAVQELRASKVDVNEDNQGALLFYTKMGFRVTSRSPVDPSGKPFPILHLEIND